MKKKILVGLLVGMISINLLGCSEKKDTGNEEGNKPTVTEEQGSKKISEKELNEKFQKNREKLNEIFKNYGIEERTFTKVEEKNVTSVKWEMQGNKSNDQLDYSFTLDDKSNEGKISLMMQAQVKTENFKTSEFDIKLDDSIISEISKVFIENNQFKYGERGIKLNNELIKSSKKDSSQNIKEKFNEGKYSFIMTFNPSPTLAISDFSITILYGDN